MTTKQATISQAELNDAGLILIAEGVTHYSTIGLKRYATANNITDKWELATAYIEYLAENIGTRTAREAAELS